ncbi:hypothetical protein D3C72_1687130 [compost metagenome]
MRSLLLGMMAVWGMGSPIGRRNSATTANQSASAPTVAASQKARTHAQAPCPPMTWLVMKPLTMAASRASAAIFIRRSCARRASESRAERVAAKAVERDVSVMKCPA